MDGKCAESNHALESLGFEIPLTGGSIIMETTLPRRGGINAMTSGKRKTESGETTPRNYRMPGCWRAQAT